MTELDVFRLGEVLWGFLNLCLSGEAKDVFGQANMLDGLNAWRLVVYDLRNSSWVRIAQLRKATKNVPSVQKLEDVNMHIMKYETNIKEYVAAAGDHVRPPDSVLKEDLFESLPEEVRIPLQWRLGELRHEKYPEFRNHIRATVNNILYHRGRLKTSVNAVDDGGQYPQPAEPQPGAGDGGGQDPGGPGFSMLEEFMAFMKGKGGGKGRKGEGKGGKGSGDGKGGQRRCINCGSTEHLTNVCPKPEVPREQRPCWRCGKPGHVGANCPSAQRPPAQAQPRAAGMVDHSGADPMSFFMIEHAPEEITTNGFVKAKHTAKATSRPMPRGITVEDWILPNQYAALAEASAERRARRKTLQTATSSSRKCKLINLSMCTDKCCSGTSIIDDPTSRNEPGE